MRFVASVFSKNNPQMVEIYQQPIRSLMYLCTLEKLSQIIESFILCHLLKGHWGIRKDVALSEQEMHLDNPHGFESFHHWWSSCRVQLLNSQILETFLP